MAQRRPEGSQHFYVASQWAKIVLGNVAKAVGIPIKELPASLQK
jgi:hypothetical protein